MHWRILPLLPLLVFVTACAGKYPYPPQFVSPAEFSARSIPAPPARDSREYNREIDGILAMQAALTPKEIAATRHQDEITPEKMVQPVLGAAYTPEAFPALYTLLRHAASDSWRIGDDTRDYWRSPRPWYADSRVRLYVAPIYSFGYPSGHTTTFGTWAHVLAALMPEHTDAFFAHAWSVGGNRIKGGAHFPHDISGGKKLAAAIYAKMRQSPRFREEFAAAAAELQAARRQGKILKPAMLPHCRPPACPAQNF